MLVHPESPADVIALADAVGSTSAILSAAQRHGRERIHRRHRQRHPAQDAHSCSPGKTFIEAPTAGNGATCKSCAHCPWMAMNGLPAWSTCWRPGAGEVHVEPALGRRARLPIDRMLAFTAALRSGQPVDHLVAGIGAA